MRSCRAASQALQLSPSITQLGKTLPLHSGSNPCTVLPSFTVTLPRNQPCSQFPTVARMNATTQTSFNGRLGVIARPEMTLTLSTDSRSLSRRRIDSSLCWWLPLLVLFNAVNLGRRRGTFSVTGEQRKRSYTVSHFHCHTHQSAPIPCDAVLGE